MNAKGVVPFVVIAVIALGVIAIIQIPSPSDTEAKGHDCSILYQVVEDGDMTYYDRFEFRISDLSLDTYLSAANTALKDTGATLSRSSPVADQVSDLAAYGNADGVWVPIVFGGSEIIEYTDVALVHGDVYISGDEYLGLSVEEQAGYSETAGDDTRYARAVSAGYEHDIFFEIIGPYGHLRWCGEVNFTVDDPSEEAFVEAANREFNQYHISIGYKNGDYSISFRSEYDNATWSNSVVHYKDDNGVWMPSTDLNPIHQYTDSAIMVGNGLIISTIYDKLDSEEQLGYMPFNVGGPVLYYYKLIDNMGTYDIDCEFIGPDGLLQERRLITLNVAWSPKLDHPSPFNYMIAANIAFEKLGGVFSDGLWFTYNDSAKNVTYYYDEDVKEWGLLEDCDRIYYEHSHMVIGNAYISTETYSKLPAEEQAKWMYYGFGDDWEYMRLPDCDGPSSH